MAAARELALSILSGIRRGKKSNFLIDKALESRTNMGQGNPHFSDRALLTELVYGTLRWQGKIDSVIKRHLTKSFDGISPFVLDALRLGAYQLLFLDKVPEYAAIYETVNLLKKGGEYRNASFANAVLRNIQKNKKEILEGFEKFSLHRLQPGRLKPEQISFHLSHPQWMIERWIDQFGIEKTIEICEANNSVPVMNVRTHTLKISREELFDLLRKEKPDLEIKKNLFSPVGLSLSQAGAVRKIEAWQRGYFQIQDEASQLAVFALDPGPNQRILDACAAPGGKTTHLAELTRDESEIVALDMNEKRMRLIEKNRDRLGLRSIHPLHCDFLEFESNDLFDRILIDAPCSSLGTLRRHPEGKWQKEETAIRFLSDLQLRLLKKGVSLLKKGVKKGGVLVYSVCTFTKEETDEVIDRLLQSEPSLQIEPLSGILPEACAPFITEKGTFLAVPKVFGRDGGIDGGMDGFFICRFSSRDH